MSRAICTFTHRHKRIEDVARLHSCTAHPEYDSPEPSQLQGTRCQMCTISPSQPVALHRVPVNQREDGSDAVWSGTTWQGFPGCLMCLSPLCCSNWQWDITHRRIDLTRMLLPLSPRNITAYMRVTDALIRSPGSSSQRFCSATSFTGLVYSVQAFTPESSTERMTDV